MTPFVIFSLPRSRSTWLSLFLSYGGLLIGHDVGVDSESIPDFIDRMKPGTCETGAAFAWPVIREYLPMSKFVTVRRDRDEVCDSLARFGLSGFQDEMRVRDCHLDDIERLPGTKRFFYEDLARMEVCADLFTHCLEKPFDVSWWQRMDALNIQVDMSKQMRKLIHNRGQIESLKDDVRRCL